MLKQSRDFEAHIVCEVFVVILLLSFFLLGFLQVDLGCSRGVCGDEGREEGDTGR